MRILAVMSHPDDMEICCAGTLIKYKKAGHDVISCHVANGNMGHFVIPPDELRLIRKREAQASGALAGIEVISADFDDLTLNASDEKQLRELIRIVRYAAPDVLITHGPDDYASDHVEVSKLVFNASFAATCPHYLPELGPAVGLPATYYADNDQGINFIPTEYVDITEEMELKDQMLACHQSQLVWLQEHDGVDALAEQRLRAAYWGRQCGVGYAEAFRVMQASGRMRPYRVLP
ncbi:MAG: PIG-L family deacetylase [Clostridia bacterium]|nr:PIG-L family deacetylase [Oscillospiraceae bacterium]MBR6748622.1 PIG-L family deacetylase [Clostridia bacterium]